LYDPMTTNYGISDVIITIPNLVTSIVQK